MTRVGIYGWGIVAPKSPNIERFRDNLKRSESWLTPFNGFGPDNFLVGTPEFDFQCYRQWIDERFASGRFQKLTEKMDLCTQYAIGSFIQALGQNPGLEQILQELGTQAHAYIGTGLGPLPTIHDESLNLYKAQRRWMRFWADPSRNSALRCHLDGSSRDEHAPASPQEAPEAAREEAESAWWDYWTRRSPELQDYLQEVREIEAMDVEGNIEQSKIRVIKRKRRLHARLQEKWGAPDPPWTQVSANLIWNIQNTPAAQISMLGKITGMSMAPVAACSTFGVALKLAMNAIELGEAKAVVVGATDPPPHALTVSAFYNARVISADAEVSKPLSKLRGTHISGGSVVWILADHEYMEERGLRPLGMEPLSVGVSSDADHIITPSKEGPTTAMRQALRDAGAPPEAITEWDLHATATPGDYLEVENLRDIVGGEVLITARKGTFGHGMSAGGGWELTAQYLGHEEGQVFPTPLRGTELNQQIAGVHNRFVFDASCPASKGLAGKLSMGIGGINACVISRPW
ncbi:MAG TPA: beta-ketoacyl synthase N-terminal-like domain-containing protein [Acidobacteriota bacterium]|nr:beta-ketoacyl synthase N-terminal-like domain-containing protein [Acidobacteriota bacterium]